jgi:ethanolamine ammonia-lyase large subunit
MDVLLTLLAAAGCTYIMGVPGSDDVMLSYQSTSFHDALYARRLLGLRPAPEFEDWQRQLGISEDQLTDHKKALPAPFAQALAELDLTDAGHG